MPALHQRQPGLMAALVDDERAAVGLIADGMHVHPVLISLVWKLLGPQRLTLVTDAMAALGAPSRQDEGGGDLRLGDQTVHVDGKRATLPDGTLAGSILTLDAASRNLVDFAACALSQAVQTVTLTPARLLGLDERKGHIAAGYDADLVLLTPDYQVAATFAGGRLLYQDDQENR